MRRLLLALLTILLPGAAIWHQHRLDAHERALSAIASEIAGRPVEMRCQGIWKNLVDVTILAGEVVFDHTGAPPDHAVLRREVCRDLKRYPRERDGDAFACVMRLEPCDRRKGSVAYSVLVFTHEAWHLHGYANEAKTQCFALQTAAFSARRLGATKEQGRALARWNLEHIHPHLPRRYQTSDCRDGGPLDMRPHTSEWP